MQSDRVQHLLLIRVLRGVISGQESSLSCSLSDINPLSKTEGLSHPDLCTPGVPYTSSQKGRAVVTRRKTTVMAVLLWHSLNRSAFTCPSSPNLTHTTVGQQPPLFPLGEITLWFMKSCALFCRYELSAALRGGVDHLTCCGLVPESGC